MKLITYDRKGFLLTNKQFKFLEEVKVQSKTKAFPELHINEYLDLMVRNKEYKDLGFVAYDFRL